MRSLLSAALAGILFSLCGCTTTQKGAAIGTILGAGTGAVIGHQSKHRTEGAVIGAAAGAIGGAVVGNQMEEKKYCPKCHKKIGGKNNFCPTCGSQLEAPPK